MRTLRSIGLCLLVATCLAGCAVVRLGERTGDTWQPPRVVTFKGDTWDDCVNYSLMGWRLDSDEIEGMSPILLARPGDLFIIGGSDGTEAVLPYREGDGTSLELRVADGRLQLGGKTVFVELDEGSNWFWLKEAPEGELASLRMCNLVSLPEEGGAVAEDVLRRLARINPHVGCMVGDVERLRKVGELFDPRCLMLSDDETTWEGEAAAPAREVICAERGIESLWFPPEAMGDLEFLSKLENLRSSVILY
ncbi:MAG: hypothetical protein J7M08_07605, partial [Planctomycetes bacterium]|nr:hypothetical protein [Planctomycetota bacterium]